MLTNQSEFTETQEKEELKHPDLPFEKDINQQDKFTVSTCVSSKASGQDQDGTNNPSLKSSVSKLS